jgi:hypothetical protein
VLCHLMDVLPPSVPSLPTYFTRKLQKYVTFTNQYPDAVTSGLRQCSDTVLSFSVFFFFFFPEHNVRTLSFLISEFSI